MRRERTNQIRFVVEELLPPIIRDTWLFKLAATLAWGKHISRLAEFRKAAPCVTAEEYDQIYRLHPRMHEETDNSLYADERNFYKVERWSKDGQRIDQMLYAGNKLEKARDVFAKVVKHRPRIRLTIRQRMRVLEQWPK